MKKYVNAIQKTAVADDYFSCAILFAAVHVHAANSFRHVHPAHRNDWFVLCFKIT